MEGSKKIVGPRLFSYYAILSCSLLWCRVESFLHIPNEAVNIGQKIVSEVEGNMIYTNAADLNDKLRRISKLYCESATQSTCFEAAAIVDENFMGREFRSSLKSELANYRMEVSSDRVVLIDICYPGSTMVSLYEVSPVYGNDSLYLEFAMQIVWSDIKSILEREAHFLLAYSDETLEEFLEAGKSSSAEGCRHQSHQQSILNLLKQLTSIQSQGFIIDQYVKSICKVLMDGLHILAADDQSMIKEEMSPYMSMDLLSRMKDDQDKWAMKLTNVTRLFKPYLSTASTTVSICEQRGIPHSDQLPSNDYLRGCDYDKKKIEGRIQSFYDRDTTHLILGVFQIYVVNEKDINKKGHCISSCSAYSRTRVYDCYDGQICAHQNRCNGTLWHCRNGISPDMRVCPSDRDKRTRYGCIENIPEPVKKKQEVPESIRYGEVCGNCRSIDNRRWTRWFWECSYCMCTCEESDRDKVGLFNLRDVTSEIDLNYVVTGVRFIEKNHVVHIQIQHGKLMEYGTVSMATVEWKPVEDYRFNDPGIKSGRDYHPISWYKRTFCMDKLESPVNHVITGFRFRLINNYLKFEIRVTEFDFKKGNLFVDKNRWVSNREAISNRTKINLENDQSSDLNDTVTNECFNFNTTSLEIDAGQSTIPFMNSASVEPTPAVPLAGARILLNNFGPSKSLVSFRLYSYNIDPHLADDL